MPTLTARERRELPDRAFAYVDREGSRRLPINDEGHVRAALARFNQVQFEDDDARAEAFKRLLLAARKYGIVPIGFMTRQMRPRTGSSAKTPKLPTGLVTLLFTDIEASTGLLEMLGDGYIDILNDVRSLMRDAVGSAGGAEVDARADEFFAVFPRATDAVQAALAIQQTLRERRWPGGIKDRTRRHPQRYAETHRGELRRAPRAYGESHLLGRSRRTDPDLRSGARGDGWRRAGRCEPPRARPVPAPWDRPGPRTVPGRGARPAGDVSAAP